MNIIYLSFAVVHFALCRPRVKYWQQYCFIKSEWIYCLKILSRYELVGC